MTISNAYLAMRQSQLASYLSTAILLTYPNATREDFDCVDKLRQRFRVRDYVNPNKEPRSYHLKISKRLTHLYIRMAIKASPEWKADTAKRYAAYLAECARQRELDPSATFFSFEGSKFGKTTLKLSSYKNLFRFTNATDIKQALDAK